ncbi:hypothetical protein O181_037066 [Austropuccinia psidii MF-1]|uniref:Uncharacterized protein n=1 Tax=Austropuccinia psidii MF-1 TaxID=1389203 RepID=A0A9Q3HAF9_9BASI|nr:hypothetical protein [Austropuccinia psidii MF-1]
MQKYNQAVLSTLFQLENGLGHNQRSKVTVRGIIWVQLANKRKLRNDLESESWNLGSENSSLLLLSAAEDKRFAPAQRTWARCRGKDSLKNSAERGTRRSFQDRFSANHQPTPLSMYTIQFITSALVVTSALATHVINVNNRCGQKFTMQVPGHPHVTSTSGGHFRYNGDIRGVIASVGNNCDINGVPCTAAEFSLVSGVSSADITLIPPHKYNHPLRITLTNGQSKYCGKAACTTAFHQDGHDERYQIQESNNPNSGITLDFC